MDEKELGKLERKTQMLRETNVALVREIEQLGGGVDLSIARIEHLIAHLVEQKILSNESAVSEANEWEKGLRGRLITIRDNFKEQIVKARAMQREQMRRAQAQQAAAIQQGEHQTQVEASAPTHDKKLILPPGAKK